MTHSPEPWHTSKGNGRVVVSNHDGNIGRLVARTYECNGQLTSHEDAKRIVACVNFCTQLPTSLLESCIKDHPERPSAALIAATIHKLTEHGLSWKWEETTL